MRLIFILLSCLLQSQFRVLAYKSAITETCYLLNNILFPNKDLQPDYPKNDICRYLESKHCCTQSVETVLRSRAHSDSRQLFFSNLIKIQDLTSQQFYNLQQLNLPFLSDSLRQTALQYQVIDNLSMEKGALVNQATLQFMDSFFNVDYMPKFCKEKIVEDMKSSLNRYFQELVFSYNLVEASWTAADDLFSTILSAKFSPSCINDLIRAGMTELSCKSCTDQTLKIPTCFDYCRDVVSTCLEPYHPLMDMVARWFPLYVEVQEEIRRYTHYNRYLALKEELEISIKKELKDEFFADVCEYHFKALLSDDTKAYTIPDPERRKRIVKALPKTEIYSTRYITFHPTPETPTSQFDPSSAGRKIFDPTMICYNHTQTVTKNNCWNGEGQGTYSPNLIPTTEDTPKDIFDAHIPRLQSKINDFTKSLKKKLVIVELSDFSNEVDASNAKGKSSIAYRPHFNTVMILIFLMIWIKKII